MRVLVTRPLHEAEATARRLSDIGHAPLVAPVMRIAALPVDLSRRAAQAVVLTSAHAVEFLPDADRAALSGLPVFAVGGRSAAAARGAGFRDVRAGGGGEHALAALVSASLPAGARALYLAGRERKGDLPDLLRARGFLCDVAECYVAVAAATLDTAAADALAAGTLDAALHYSARSAEIFARLAAAAGRARAAAVLLHLCLSAAVAAGLSGLGAERVRVAARPDETSLFALLPGAGDTPAPDA